MEENSQEQQSQERQKRSYANSPWINVYDWQVTRHTNSKTNEEFWDVKLAKGTFIEVGGERVDVSGYHFHTGTRLKAFRVGGRTIYDTIDHRRKLLGYAV